MTDRISGVLNKKKGDKTERPKNINLKINNSTQEKNMCLIQ